LNAQVHRPPERIGFSDRDVFYHKKFDFTTD
jgi:hypothetical protein